MKVSEQFYSLQGEGKTAGVPAYFLRLSNCNLLCGGKGTQNDKKLHDGATWRCDTIEVWRKGVNKSYQDIIDTFGGPIFLQKLARREAHLIITGGEPLLHRNDMDVFIQRIMQDTEYQAYIEVETNGTIKPTSAMLGGVDLWNISPKLKNSGMDKKLRYMPGAIEVIKKHSRDFILKFVVTDPLEDIEEILNDYYLPLGLKKHQIYLMPGASDIDTYNKRLPIVADLCKDIGFCLGTRLQIDIWNQTTGV